MKALFLVDNIPAIDIFAPIIENLPSEWCSVLINYNWSKRKQIVINNYARRLDIKCETLKRRNKKGVERIIKQEHPDIIVLTREESTPIEKLFAMGAKDKDIPTLLVPHGLLMPMELKLWGIDGKFPRLKYLYKLFKQGYRKLVKERISLLYLIQAVLFRIRNDFQDKGVHSNYKDFSKIACSGDITRSILIKYGVNPPNIVITGNPKFDLFFGVQEQTSKKSKEICVLLITNYLVEFGSWTEKQREDYTSDICYVAECVRNCELIIKIHPVMESLKDYKKIVESHNYSATIYQKEPLAELVKKCDIAITTLSSGGVEVMVGVKPLIIYNPFNDVTQYDENSGVTFANNVGELIIAIERIIKNGLSNEQKELARDFVYRQAYLQDGKASERIANLIAKMTEKAPYFIESKGG